MSEVDRRVEVVKEHVRLKNAHDFPGCIATFGKARYEVVDDAVFDGPERVDVFLEEARRAFPDFHFEPTCIAPAGNSVLAEGRFTGTHEGFWRGLPATGRRVDFPMCVIFDFEGDDMVAERLYFDLGTPLCQLGVAYDPDSFKGKVSILVGHPVTVASAALRTAWLGVVRRRRETPHHGDLRRAPGLGVGVGARQIWQARRKPDQLLNPLFANRVAIRLFILHIVVVTADLFVIWPLAITHKGPLWYWGGRIALLSSSLPLAAYLNRNPQSFGKLIGRWVTFRNFFEVGGSTWRWLATWIMTRRYTESLLQRAAGTEQVPEVGTVGSH